MTYHALRSGPEDGPRLFTFHGTGGDETQFHDLARRMRPDARVISPRGDVSEHGALRYFRRTGEGVYDMDDLWLRARAMADFMRAEGDGPAMAFGYSNGANILAAVLMIAPDLIGRAGLLHPLVPWSPEPVPLDGTRVLVTSGDRDPICPAPLTRALEGWLEANGAAVETLRHPGGHELRPEEAQALATFLA